MKYSIMNTALFLALLSFNTVPTTQYRINTQLDSATPSPLLLIEDLTNNTSRYALHQHNETTTISSHVESNLTSNMSKNDTTISPKNTSYKQNKEEEQQQHFDNRTVQLKEDEGIHLFHFDFKHVKVPFIICVWVLIASIAKIVFHRFEWLSSTIPESCVLILLGILIGYIGDLTHGHSGIADLSSSVFFLFLLPSIILDAGYFMTSQIFYNNIGTILLYAVVGTIFNTFMLGLSLFSVSSSCDVNISLHESLEFGSLISAVDPVAVLAVFEEVQVNQLLHMLVFGESVLNDAASVVLYRTFEHLPKIIDAKQVGLAIVSFLEVAIGGTLIGVVFAFVTSLITKFTKKVLVIEPVFVFIMSYLAYLTAEMFHLSGIMSILFCGLIMKTYVQSNVSTNSHITIKHCLKLLSSSSEAVVFLFLGEALVQMNHKFNLLFVLYTLLFCTVFRAIGVVVLTAIANRFGRLHKVEIAEQIIMSYGGLRGAVAFCLANLLQPTDCSNGSEFVGTEECELKEMLVTTTISVVCFTVFVQGSTIKKLVDLLGVKKSNKAINGTEGDDLVEENADEAGIALGSKLQGPWLNLFKDFNSKHLRRWLTRDPEELNSKQQSTASKRDKGMTQTTMSHESESNKRAMVDFFENPEYQINCENLETRMAQHFDFIRSYDQDNHQDNHKLHHHHNNHSHLYDNNNKHKYKYKNLTQPQQIQMLTSANDLPLLYNVLWYGDETNADAIDTTARQPEPHTPANKFTNPLGVERKDLPRWRQLLTHRSASDSTLVLTHQQECLCGVDEKEYSLQVEERHSAVEDNFILCRCHDRYGKHCIDIETEDNQLDYSTVLLRNYCNLTDSTTRVCGLESHSDCSERNEIESMCFESSSASSISTNNVSNNPRCGVNNKSKKDCGSFSRLMSVECFETIL